MQLSVFSEVLFHNRGLLPRKWRLEVAPKTYRPINFPYYIVSKPGSKSTI